MFLKIIHKSEASYLCHYQKTSYAESVKRSFSTQHLCSKLSISEVISGSFQDRTKQDKVRSLTIL